VKHLKLFNEAYRPRKFESQEEKDFYNFVNRLERALNKFLGTSNVDNEKNKYGESHTYVGSYFDAKPPHYPISICINSYSTQATILKEYLQEKKIKYFVCYDLTMGQAEELLKELKMNFVTKFASKYNI
jgi:hypothetical protein